MKAKNLWSIILIIFVLILPSCGKSLDYLESLFFLGIPLIIFLFNITSKKTQSQIPKKDLYLQLTLVLLYLVSTAFSQNIGISYYSLFYFINILFIVNIYQTIRPKYKNLSDSLIFFSLTYSIIFLLNKLKILPLHPKNDQDNFILQIWGHSYLADFIVLSIPLVLSKLNLCFKKYFPILIIITVALILTNSRSSLIALIFGLFFLKKINKTVKILLISLTIALITIFFSTLQTSTTFKSFSGARLQYWQEAIKSFTKSPLFGNGPSTFAETNRLLRNDPREITNHAHSSFLSFLSENGILFTLVFFYYISAQLVFQFKHHRLIFIVCIISLVNSLFDPSWNNFGILTVTLVLLSTPSPKNPFPTPSVNPRKILLFASLTLFVFFLSKTTSDLLYLSGSYNSSIIADPFNLNSRLVLVSHTSVNSPQWQSNTSFLEKYFKNDQKTFQTIINVQPLPHSEHYYWHLINLDPLNSHPYFQSLFSYYQTTSNFQKINDLQNKLLSIFPLPSKSTKDNLETSKTFYKIGYFYYQNNQIERAVVFFEKAAMFSPLWGFFHLELANAYGLNNQPDKAIYQLSVECQKYSLPTKECRNYLKEFPQKPIIRNLETYDFPPQ